MNSLKQMLQAAVEEIQLPSPTPTVTIHTDYSGRMMFGDTCFALSGSAHEVKRALARLVINATKHSMTDGIDQAVALRSELLADCWITQARYDDLGTGQIVYWPNLHRNFPDLMPR